jgi:hypothetical protein
LFSLRTVPAAARWSDGAGAGAEASLFDFVGISRRGPAPEAQGAEAAEKLREEFNSLLAGNCCDNMRAWFVICDV